MSFAMAMLMAGGAILTLTGETIESENSAGAIAGVRINADGTVDQNIDNQFFQINADTDWIIPNAAANDSYQVRATVLSGSLSSGTVDEWLDLDDDRPFSVVATPGNTTTATIRIEIGIGGTAIVSADFTLTADAT